MMQTSHDMITWIPIWIVSHRHTHTHMLSFVCYTQHFVSPMLEFRDMFFLTNHDANVARYDHMDPHLDSFTQTHTHMLSFVCYIQHFVSPMLEFRDIFFWQTVMQGFGWYMQHFVSPMLEFRMGLVDKP